MLLRFGPQDALFGVLCRPSAQAAGMAVVIGNANGDPHCAPMFKWRTGDSVGLENRDSRRLLLLGSQACGRSCCAESCASAACWPGRGYGCR